MIFTLIGADFSKSNIGTLSNWTILRELGAGATYTGPSFVEKNAIFSATVTLSEGYEISSAGITITMGGIALDESYYSIVDNVITFTIDSVTGSIMIKVPTLNTSTGEEDEPVIPDTPTNYTFTIIPDPSTAIVTLTASGYSQNDNSITVPNGTDVSWNVSADGYTEQNGTWTANGSDETLPVTLDKESSDPEGGAEDISAYIQEGKSIIKAGELSDSAEMFTVVNYPVKGATYYLIPYARNAFCLTAAGGASGGILAGGGKPDATLRAAGTAATMSVCFKYSDISPDEVTITETTAPTTTT
jgi:hypothetical protein